jgi:hypothetical protein
MNNQDDNGTFVRNHAVNAPLSRAARNFRVVKMRPGHNQDSKHADIFHELNNDTLPSGYRVPRA